MMQESGNALSEVLLERLEDIHRAAEPGWWPPAPGWWFVAALVVAALAWLAVRLLARLKIRLRRRRLLHELEALADRFDPQAQPADYLGALNRLFRAIALRAFPDTDCARLQGTAWVAFIREHIPGGGSESLEALESGPYQPNSDFTSDFDPAELQAQARLWVLNHG